MQTSIIAISQTKDVICLSSPQAVLHAEDDAISSAHHPLLGFYYSIYTKIVFYTK